MFIGTSRLFPFGQDKLQLIARRDVVWIHPQNKREMVGGLVELPPLGEGNPQVKVGIRVFRIDAHRFEKMGDGFIGLPLPQQFDPQILMGQSITGMYP